MPRLESMSCGSRVEPVVDMIHDVAVADPYRWLEHSGSPETRRWIEQQTHHARAHFDQIPSRQLIRERIRGLLAVETHDSVQIAGSLYVFRKRLPAQEQAGIFMRVGAFGQDRLLLDPARLGSGTHASVRPLCVSPDERLLLYEVKQGGERTGTFALLDIRTGETLPDTLPRGCLRGFAFAPNSESFCYVHEPANAEAPFRRSVHRHVLGTPFKQDQEVFCAGEGEELRLGLISDGARLGFLAHGFDNRPRTTLYLTTFESLGSKPRIVVDTDSAFGPRLVQGKIFAITDRDAPNLRIVEISPRGGKKADWIDVLKERNVRLGRWVFAGNYLCASYVGNQESFIVVCHLAERRTTQIPFPSHESHRLLSGSPTTAELLVETESFTEPPRIWHYNLSPTRRTLWTRKEVPFDPSDYAHRRVSYTSKDGTVIPMSLLGRKDVLQSGSHPVIMTSYGGFGIPMSPQFSVLVACLIEQGCLLAVPSIRGGSDFGAAWHEAAKRRKRQNAYDDFLCAAEHLLNSARTTPDKLAIFGGSNSGLLVLAAMTQRPELFRVVIAIAPIADMLRYHLFDGARLWKAEFGTAEDAADFQVLRTYSPYHRVQDGQPYPAVLIVSGDADTNCNSLHARKMTARLQAATSSQNPVLLDYSPHRGHSPVLPLSDRIEALTDRIAFLTDQLGLTIPNGAEKCASCS